MTDDQVKQILGRVLTWPRTLQEDAAHVLLELEAHDSKAYHPDENEWTAIKEGWAQAERGEAVPLEEIAALLMPRGQ